MLGKKAEKIPIRNQSKAEKRKVSIQLNASLQFSLKKGQKI